MSDLRHEYKYLVDPVRESIVLAKVSSALRPDLNADDRGVYTVRSLYFDDLDDSCLYENEDGTDQRSKFRIRYYGHDSGRLRLEKKSKIRGMTGKKSCEISEEEFWLLYRGQGIRVRGDAVKNELAMEFYLRGMRPKTIVTYDRIPYVYSSGNVRITFDRVIASSGETERFLTGDYRQRPALEVGTSVLEVKFDAFLPRHIKEIVQTDGLAWTSFSKYRICRWNGI